MQGIDGDTTEDAFLGGRMRLIQPARGHRIGTDALLLAAMTPRGAAAIADIGAGAGGAGIAAALTNSAARLILAEKDAVLAELASRNLALNGLSGRGRAMQADVFAPEALREAAGLARESADCVLTNPPYFDGSASRASPDALRAAAHHLSGGTLDGWIKACVSALKPGGALCLIHRADALGEALEAMRSRCGGLALRLVYPRATEPSSRLLLRGVKGSRAPLKILPPLALHEADSAFTAEAEAIHRELAPSL